MLILILFFFIILLLVSEFISTSYSFTLPKLYLVLLNSLFCVEVLYLLLLLLDKLEEI